MLISRLKRARYTLDPRLTREEKQKLKTGKGMDVDLKAIDRMWEKLEPERKIVKISKDMGLSKAYTKILIKRLKRKRAYE